MRIRTVRALCRPEISRPAVLFHGQRSVLFTCLLRRAHGDERVFQCLGDCTSTNGCTPYSRVGERLRRGLLSGAPYTFATSVAFAGRSEPCSVGRCRALLIEIVRLEPELHGKRIVLQPYAVDEHENVRYEKMTDAGQVASRAIPTGRLGRIVVASRSPCGSSNDSTWASAQDAYSLTWPSWYCALSIDQHCRVGLGESEQPVGIGV